MIRRQLALVVLALTAIGAGCDAPARPATQEVQSADSAVMQERAARVASALARPDTTAIDKPIALWELPDALKEISGLALTSDGRLLTHGDNRARVFEVDPRRGVIIKQFTVGAPAVRGDFEAITTVGNSVLLLTSGGMLLRFPEGGDGAVVQYTMRNTELGDECEFEGMAYEASTTTLLLACKKTHDRALKDSLVIFRVPLEPGNDIKARMPPHLAIAMSKVIGSNDWEGFHPSDITINPFNGDYVLVASRERALLEITPAGAVVFARPLPSGHEQAEGIAITKDQMLIISDEAKGGPARMTLYRWPR